MLLHRLQRSDLNKKKIPQQYSEHANFCQSPTVPLQTAAMNIFELDKCPNALFF